MSNEATQSSLIELPGVPAGEQSQRSARLKLAPDAPSPDDQGIIARPRLFKLLERPGRVISISAPAGSGKTQLVRSWIQASGLRARTAWVAVGRDESSPQGFWLSVLDALRETGPGAPLIEPVSEAPALDGSAIIAQLLDNLRSLDEPVVLVISDLHKLNDEQALAQLELLLAEAPPQLRFVLCSRRDPQLGLHRLRLAGELSEIRARDLCFSLEESRALLASSGVHLPAHALQQLHRSTEGWATGLRLAALALREQADPERFVAEFTGSERTVAEYLLAEVLASQPGHVRRLLLRTSLLETVTGALADLLTGTAGSRRVLQELENANAFVVSLDAGRSCFRYHSLFGDLLRLELERCEPSAISELHRSAAGWYEQQGDMVEAIRHAQAAGEWAYAVRLLADHSPSIALDGRVSTLAALIAAFPASATSTDAELAVVCARSKAFNGSVGEADTYLKVAERNAGAVADDRRPRFEFAFSLARLILARRCGDLDGALQEAQPLLAAQSAAAKDIAHENDVRAYAHLQLGIVELWAGRHSDAGDRLQQALELSEAGERPYLQVQCLSYLAMWAARHSFERARELAAQAIEIAQRHGWDSERVTGAAHVALGNIDLWQGRFAAASEHLTRAQQAVRAEVEPGTGVMLLVAQGRLFTALEQHADALDAYRGARRLEDLVVMPQLLTLPTRRLLAQAQLRAGQEEAARATLAELQAGERADTDVARTAVASAALSAGDEQAAIEALEPLAEGSSPSSPMLLVEATLMRALAHHRLGERSAGERDIETALELAEADMLIWPFAVTPARELVERHPAHRTAHGALLKEVLNVLGGSAPAARQGQISPLDEPLTESELRVLRFLPTNLSASDIGSELYLSVFTVKTHIRHIYAKMGVHRRADAVLRARDLGLLGASPKR